MIEGNQTRLASCIVVQDVGGNILLTKRARHMRTFPNSWILPGGHVEVGESLEHSVVRELREETGISIEIMQITPYFAFESSILTKKHFSGGVY